MLTPLSTTTAAESTSAATHDAPSARDARRESLRGLDYEAGAAALAPVQRAGAGHGDAEQVRQAAAQGVSGAGGPLPHFDRIQQAFGPHDVSDVQAHVGGRAAQASAAMGATAYASGNAVAFQGAPDLHTAAHEAAHIVQQRAGVSLSGGVGQAGDSYEQNADAVADRVVAGRSAADLLGPAGGGGASAVQQRANAPVQRYGRVPVNRQNDKNWAGLGATLRVSDDGNMVVRDSGTGAGGHDFFTTPSIIGNAENKLVSMASPFSVATGGDKLTGRAPGDRRGPVKTLHRVVLTNARNVSTGDDMTTFEGCNMHAMDFMGVAGDHSERGLGQKGTGGTTYFDKDAGEDAGIMANLRKDIAEHEGHVDPDRGTTKRAYQELTPQQRAAHGTRLGINAGAVPTETGQALQVHRAAGDAKGGFMMHFAPVLALSGGDYVTVENWGKSERDRAPGDTPEASNAWHFRMYGPVKTDRRGRVTEDQSFHGEHVKDGEYGGEESTMTLLHEVTDRPG